jgi:DNA-binding response OmpR family regulator
MARLLLVEDTSELRVATAQRLTREGYVVDAVESLGLAIEAVLSAQYRAVLLDRRLPDGDGLSLIPVLRTRPAPPPVIVLTALDDIPERVTGLDAGAADYLVKPFAFDELMARLRALLRRGSDGGAVPRIRLGALDYDPSERQLRVGDRDLAVPRRELAILDALARRAGRVVTRERLIAEAYSFDDSYESNALEAQVSRLRRRLADAGAGVAVHVVRGVGYMLAEA